MAQHSIVKVNSQSPTGRRARDRAGAGAGARARAGAGAGAGAGVAKSQRQQKSHEEQGAVVTFMSPSDLSDIKFSQNVALVD